MNKKPFVFGYDETKNPWDLRPEMRTWIENHTPPCVACGRKEAPVDKRVCHKCEVLGTSASKSSEDWVKELKRLSQGCAGPSSLYVRISKWMDELEQWPVGEGFKAKYGQRSPFGKAAVCDISRRRVVATAIVMGLV